VTAARARGAEEHSGAHDQDGDEPEAGYPVSAGGVAADPFGTHDDAGYGGTGPEPALGVPPHLDDDPAPWEGLAQQIPPTPALRDRPEPEAPAPAAPRRGRGAHAARHGKPSRRSRGEG
jgi:hypothetical protein